MQTMERATIWKIRDLVFFLLLTFALAGCGFQLKQTADIPASFGPVGISGIDKFSTLYKSIQNAFRQSSIETVSDNSARHVIAISRIRNERRVLSVDGSGKVSEYELIKTLRFSVLGQNGNSVTDSQTISANRSYSVSRSDILSKELEEEDIGRRMEEVLAEQMLRFISSRF